MAKKSTEPKATTPTQVEEPKESIAAGPDVKEEFTQEALVAAWKNYAKTIEKTNLRLFSILNNHLPVLKDNQVLELKLRNATQQNEINKEKLPLLRALKQTLNNNYISLVISLSQEDNGPRKAFTAADKFKLMLEKNPALKELKNKFGLDIE